MRAYRNIKAAAPTFKVKRVYSEAWLDLRKNRARSIKARFVDSDENGLFDIILKQSRMPAVNKG